MASRRLKSDRFFTDDYTPEIYTQAGLDWIDDNTMVDVIKRHYPQLGRRCAASRTRSSPGAAWREQADRPGSASPAEHGQRPAERDSRVSLLTVRPSGASIRSSGRCSTACSATGSRRRHVADQPEARRTRASRSPRSGRSRTRRRTSRRSSTHSPPRSAGSGTRGHAERGGNTKTMASSRPTSRSTRACRSTCGAASSPSRGPGAPGCASPARARTSRATSTTSAS